MHAHNNIKILPIKNKTNNNKHVICQFYSIQLQKWNLIQNSPGCAAPKNAVVKKDVKSKVVAEKWLWW